MVFTFKLIMTLKIQIKMNDYQTMCYEEKVRKEGYGKEWNKTGINQNVSLSTSQIKDKSKLSE